MKFLNLFDGFGFSPVISASLASRASTSGSSLDVVDFRFVTFFLLLTSSSSKSMTKASESDSFLSSTDSLKLWRRFDVDAGGEKTFGFSGVAGIDLCCSAGFEPGSAETEFRRVLVSGP